MSFDRFPAQAQAVQLLQRSLGRNRLAHAYLFTGNDLDPLAALARTLAKTLNCQAAPASGPGGLPTDSCDACPSCRRIEEGIHPDVQWVRPESKLRVITIDQIRGLMHAVQLTPTEARWKVGIIAAAERMNPQAANAFLKTLEEPPPRSVLILLSTDPQRLLETILSRCRRLNFGGDTGPAPTGPVAEWVAGLVRRIAGETGSLLGRYRLLGDVLSRLGEIKSGIEETLGARSPAERYPDADPKLKEKWEEELAAAVEAEYRHERERLLRAVQYWLRDVWLGVLTGRTEGFGFPALAGESRKVAARVTAAEATGNLRIIEETQRMLRTNVQEALCLEVALIKLRL